MLRTDIQIELVFAGDFLKKAQDAQQKQFSENDALYRKRANAADRQRDQIRSLRINSGENATPSGRCKGYEDYGKFNVRYDDGSIGTLFLSCTDDCWNVSLGGSFGVVTPGLICGDFDGSWVAGRDHSKPNMSLLEVGNFVLQYGH